MYRSLIISSLIVLMSFLSVPAWGGEGRYVIEEDTEVAPNKNRTDSEQCMNHYNSKDYGNAYPICLKASEQRDASSQFLLGGMYYYGQGVIKNYTEAANLFLQAAEQGHAGAQFALGWMFYNGGQGVPKNHTEALKWYYKAADQGDKNAQTALADINKYDGDKKQGTYQKVDTESKQDDVFEIKIHDLSAVLLLKLVNSSLANIQAEQVSILQYELASKYLKGDGIEKNRPLAEKWLFHSISNDGKNKKSTELIEKEFEWHCILNDNNVCSEMINMTSIKHDRNLSWFWSRSTFAKIPKSDDKNETAYSLISFNTYEVMNCNNRTSGSKSIGILDENLKSGRNIITKDIEIEFKPLEPGVRNDRLFNYICGTTDAVKKNENIKDVTFGTGWPVQPGFVVTNQHVINGKNNIIVMLATGEKLSATLLIEDKTNDLALLQVNQPSKLPPAIPVARFSAKTGSKVFTIGYPHPDMMGAKSKLTEGIVNAVTGYKDDPRTIQISAPVQAGNSGGPLLNMNGEVVGIVTAKLSAVKIFNWTGDLPQNVNYAVKIPYLSALISSVDEQVSGIKTLSAKSASLESLTSRIQNSVLMIIAE